VWCRYALLAGAAFCDGFVVGPLVDMAVGLNPAMVLTAFLATASIFACFSGAGMTTLSSLYITLLEATYLKANANACVHALPSHQDHIHVRRPLSDCTSCRGLSRLSVCGSASLQWAAMTQVHTGGYSRMLDSFCGP